MYRENTDSWNIPPGNEFRWSIGPNVPFVRKIKLFTDEWHDLAAAIRKYGVFADGPALPFRDTGFWARNGVSQHGETAQWAKICSRYRFFSRKGCIAAWESLCFRKTCPRYRLLDGKWCVVAWGNSSIGENPFTTGQLGRMRVG